MENSQVMAEIKQFLDAQGRLIQLPKKRRKLICSLLYLSAHFEGDREYSEAQVNGILNTWHTYGDCATLRRTLFDAGFLRRKRDGSVYRLANPLPALADFGGWISGRNTEFPLAEE